ncbi:MAG: TldD/PmbA family protein [Euryarchaeota archaeon]|nr:TldD/PmbA family protein [Euryarchaeota archaeon]
MGRDEGAGRKARGARSEAQGSRRKAKGGNTTESPLRHAPSPLRPRPLRHAPFASRLEEPEEIARRLLKLALALGDVEQAEAYVSRNRMTMTRLETLRRGQRVAGPAAQQVSTFMNMEACVRVVVKGAVGTAATVHLDSASLGRVASDARSIARAMPPDPNFWSLAGPSGRRPARLAPDRAILEGGAFEALVDGSAEAAGLCPSGVDLAGSVIAISEVFGVCNSLGIDTGRCEDTRAVAQLTAERVEGGEVLSSGMGWSASRSLSGLDAAAAARQALELGLLRPRLRTVPEGDYDVLLGPYSVADMLDHMLVPQLGMAQIYTGTSWLPAERAATGNGVTLRRPLLGTTVAAPSVSLREEPHLEGAMGSRTFDDEGVPTAPRPLIDEGIWRGVFSNSYYAHLYGLEPPGNGFRFGPRPGRMASAPLSNSPTNLVLRPGDLSFEELVERCRCDALYIPRTWYTYPTRYGASGFSSSNRSTAFLIRKGELVPVAPNAFKLRGDMARVLREARGIGREASTATTWSASFCSIVPHVLSAGLRVEKPSE